MELGNGVERDHSVVPCTCMDMCICISVQIHTLFMCVCKAATAIISLSLSLSLSSLYVHVPPFPASFINHNFSYSCTLKLYNVMKQYLQAMYMQMTGSRIIAQFVDHVILRISSIYVHTTCTCIAHHSRSLCMCVRHWLGVLGQANESLHSEAVVYIELSLMHRGMRTRASVQRDRPTAN